MRSVTVFWRLRRLTVLLVLFLGPATATPTGDAEGDQWTEVRWLGARASVPSDHCSVGAADIVAALWSVEADLVVSLHFNSADLRVICDGAAVATAFVYRAETVLFTEDAEVRFVIAPASPVHQDHVRLHFADGQWGMVAAAHTRAGSSISWSTPRAGIADTSDGPRPFDLRGVSYEQQAETIAIATLTPYVAVGPTGVPPSTMALFDWV